MQDRNYDKLAKQGWSDMQAILDREMPVRKKRRVLLWLFLFMGLLSGAAGLAYYNTVTDANGDRTLLVSEQENSSDHKTEIKGTEHKAVDGVDKDKELISTDVELKSTRNNTSRQLEGRMAEQDISNVEEPLKNEMSKEKQVLNEEKSGLQQEEQEEVLAKPKNAKTTVRLLENDELIEVSGEQSYIVVDPAPILLKKNLVRDAEKIDQLAFSDFVEKRNIDLNPSVLKRGTRIPVHFIVEAGASYASYNNMRGLYAGMGFEKSLTRRWSLRTGVRYMALASEKYYRSTFNSADLLSEFDAEIPNVSTPDELQDQYGADKTALDSKQFEYVISRVERLNVLSVPLYVSYQLSRRNFVGLGMTYHALLSTSPDVLKHSGNGAFVTANSYRTFDVTRKNQFSLSTSYRYEIHKRLSLDVEGQVGVSGVLRARDRQGIENTLSYISAGLSYRL